jgi:hypothetical protein
MNPFPATEAKVAYDHLTFRSTVDALKAATPLDWNEFWVRVRDDEVMARVADAMLRAAAVELCQSPVSADLKQDPASNSGQGKAPIAVVTAAAPTTANPTKNDSEKPESPAGWLSARPTFTHFRSVPYVRTQW